MHEKINASCLWFRENKINAKKRTGIENTSDCCMRNSNLDNQIWKILLFGLHLYDAYVCAWFPINGRNIRYSN